MAGEGNEIITNWRMRLMNHILQLPPSFHSTVESAKCGYMVNVKGYSVDAKGYMVDVMGYSVDAKGYMDPRRLTAIMQNDVPIIAAMVNSYVDLELVDTPSPHSIGPRSGKMLAPFTRLVPASGIYPFSSRVPKVASRNAIPRLAPDPGICLLPSPDWIPFRGVAGAAGHLRAALLHLVDDVAHVTR
eukprot:8549900-Pyramimonas_sp.AAC.1